MRKFLLAGVAALALATSPALAQHHGGGGPGGGGPHGGGMGGGPHMGGGMPGGGPHFRGGPPGGHFGGPGPERFVGGHFVGRGPGGPRISEHFGPDGPAFFRPHRRVFIAGGPGWIWCDAPEWYGSPWWGDYCGTVYDYYGY